MDSSRSADDGNNFLLFCVLLFLPPSRVAGKVSNGSSLTSSPVVQFTFFLPSTPESISAPLLVKCASRDSVQLRMMALFMIIVIVLCVYCGRGGGCVHKDWRLLDFTS